MRLVIDQGGSSHDGEIMRGIDRGHLGRVGRRRETARWSPTIDGGTRTAVDQLPSTRAPLRVLRCACGPHAKELPITIVSLVCNSLKARLLVLSLSLSLRASGGRLKSRRTVPPARVLTEHMHGLQHPVPPLLLLLLLCVMIVSGDQQGGRSSNRSPFLFRQADSGTSAGRCSFEMKNVTISHDQKSIEQESILRRRRSFCRVRSRFSLGKFHRPHLIRRPNCQDQPCSLGSSSSAAPGSIGGGGSATGGSSGYRHLKRGGRWQY